MDKSIQKDIKNFKIVPPDSFVKEITPFQKRTLDEIREEDFGNRIKMRNSISSRLFLLLIGQNLIVFGIVFFALIKGEVQDLQLIFSILITTTLGETAFAIHVIVKFLFKEINYNKDNS
jgi:hypothetical protein